MVEASPRIAETLNINLGSRVIHLIRLVSHKGHPFLLNQAILKFDPLAPIVEAEMELSSLSGIFSGEGSHYVKKAFLRVEPYALNATESLQLKCKESETAFRINYTFYNYKDLPLGSGWFLTPKKYIALSAKIGLWD
jgi:GntR family transcriptional regulator